MPVICRLKKCTNLLEFCVGQPFSHALVANKFPGILWGLFLWGSTTRSDSNHTGLGKNCPTSRNSALCSSNIVLFTERHETWSFIADKDTFITLMQVIWPKWGTFGMHAGAELMALVPTVSYILCVRSSHNAIKLALLVSCGVLGLGILD